MIIEIGNGKIYILGSHNPPPLNGDEYTDFNIVTLNAKDRGNRVILDKFANAIARRILKGMGFTEVEGNKAFNPQKFKLIKGIRSTEAISWNAFVTSEGYLALTLDPTIRTIAFLGEYCMTKQKPPEDFINRTVRVKSSTGKWKDAILVKIQPKALEQKGYLPDPNKTLKELWENQNKWFLKRWNIELLSSDDLAEVVFEGKTGKSFLYPLSTVRIRLDTINYRRHTNRKRNLVGECNQLLQKVNEWFNHNSIEIENQQLVLEKDWADERQLEQRGFAIGHYKEGAVIRIGNGHKFTTKSGMDLVRELKEHGPFSGPIDLTLDLVCPESFKLGSALLSKLVECASVLKLGQWKVGEIAKVGRDHKKLNHLMKEIRGKPNRAVIVIGGEKANNTHSSLRSKLHQDGIVTKGIAEQSARAVVAAKRVDHPIATVMCRSLYSRSLPFGGALAVLEQEPRIFNGAREPVILAMDISRDPGSVKSYSATITAIDRKGIVVHTPNKTSFREGYFIPERVKEWIEQVIKALTSHNRWPDEFIYLHDGALNRVQLEDLKNGIKLAMDEYNRGIQRVKASLGKKEGYEPSFLIIEEAKNVPERFLSKVPVGTYLLDDRGFAWLVASRPTNFGNQKLLRLKVYLGNEDGEKHIIKWAVELIHLLRYLHPSTSFNYSRVSYPKQMAHKTSNVTRLLGNEPPFSYH